MTVLLTGASGFLGRQVFRILGSDDMRALVLPDDPARNELQALAEVLLGDITDPQSLVGAFDGVDQVVHLAGYVNGGRGDIGTFMAVNAHGTRNIALAAKAAGVRHLVYTSSITVYGHAENVDETARLVPTPGYPQSKIEAETALRDILPTQTTILRLPLVLGPGDAGFMCPAVEGFRQMGRIILIGSGQSPWSVLAVSDAARAVSLCLTKPETRGKTYNVLGETVTNGEILRAMGGYAGCQQEVRLPYLIAWGLAVIIEALGGAGLTRAQVRALSRPMSFQGDRFKALGFVPRQGWRSALTQGVEWCL